MKKGTVIVTSTEARYDNHGAQALVGIDIDSLLADIRKGIEIVEIEVDRMDAHSFIQLLITDVERGYKIQAVKHLRDFTGASLADSKQTIDRMIGLGKKFGTKVQDNWSPTYDPYPGDDYRS